METIKTCYPAREAFTQFVLEAYPKWRSLYEAMEKEAHDICFSDQEIEEYTNYHPDPFINSLIAIFYHADLFPPPIRPTTLEGARLARIGND